MAPPKRKGLTLEQRIDVIKRRDRGESSRQISLDLGVGKSQICNVYNKKTELLTRWDSGASGSRTISVDRQSPFETVNKLLYDFFQEAKTRNIPINGSMLREQGSLLATQHNVDNFTASDGWLAR